MILSASSSGQGAAKAPDVEVLLVRLANELFAVRSASVREVMRHRPWTPVPGAPVSLPGIISRRGQILPIVEPRPLFGFEQAELTRAARLVLVEHDDVSMALLVEEVIDLVALPADTIEPVPTALVSTRSRFLTGVARFANRPVSLLDLDELIAGLREAD
jgi:purine-binding chemotaxis protein CheW